MNDFFGSYSRLAKNPGDVYLSVMLDVQGQSRAVSQLQRALRAGRLGHTWIFAGPYGVGKYRLAVELARTALCDHPRVQANEGAIGQLEADFPLTLACGVCESCKAIHVGAAGGGSHPDLHIITKELIRYHDRGGKSKGTTLSIDVIRGEITGDTDAGKEPKIYKRSFRGKGKWFIIDEADLMDVAAQNSLLKTLEEPPPESFLVLITTSPQELLATIRSRSQIVMLNELPDEVIVKALIGEGLANGDAMLLARMARGSLGRAQRFAEDIRTIAEKNAKDAERKAKRAEKGGAGEEEEEEDDSPFIAGGALAWVKLVAEKLDGLVLGRAAASDVAGAMNQCAGQYAKLELVRDPLASKDQATRRGIGLMLTLAADWFDDRLRQAIGAPHAVALPAASGGLDPEMARQLIRAARDAEGEIDMNANMGLVLSATCTEWERILRAPVMS